MSRAFMLCIKHSSTKVVQIMPVGSQFDNELYSHINVSLSTVLSSLIKHYGIIKGWPFSKIVKIVGFSCFNGHGFQETCFQCIFAWNHEVKIFQIKFIKLMKGKARRKQSLHTPSWGSLLKLFNYSPGVKTGLAIGLSGVH